MHVHFPPGSRTILTADEQLRQELVQFCTYKVAISWHVLKYCVETILETGSCLLVYRLFTTTQTLQRWEIPVEVPLQLAVVKNITIRDSCPKSGQIRSKFWPEPDLAGFPKKGQMPDLPEPEPKSGTSLPKITHYFCSSFWLSPLCLSA